MGEKVNCWEHKDCGRQPGGQNCGELGVCPAAVANSHDGVNGGLLGGRSCWAVAGTLCDGETQGEMASKIGDCLQCDFFQIVTQEEQEFVLIPQVASGL